VEHPGRLTVYPRLTTLRHKGEKLPKFWLKVCREDGEWRMESMEKWDEGGLAGRNADLFVENVLELLPAWSRKTRQDIRTIAIERFELYMRWPKHIRSVRLNLDLSEDHARCQRCVGMSFSRSQVPTRALAVSRPTLRPSGRS
jgi:hypothetical protein